MHPKLFIEDKLRAAHSAVTLWRETKTLADKEHKIPVVCLCEKGKKGFWFLVHSDNVKEVLATLLEMEQGYICADCAKVRRGVWPAGHCATGHQGLCPDCGVSKGLASVDDWDWPKGSRRPEHGAGRD